MSEEMTRTERNDLAALTRKRAKVAKDAAKQRAAELIAKAEDQLSAEFSAQDVRWSAAMDIAKDAADAANAKIREALAAEGVPESFMPSVGLGWMYRGENAVGQRRSELRLKARARIDAELKAAHAAIEAASVDVQTQLLAGGLTTDAARRFLETMPTADALLPPDAVDRALRALMSGEPS